MKILRPYSGTGAVFFPLGKPPKGTCEFATPRCLKYCYAEKDKVFDDEMTIEESDKWEIYDAFMNLHIVDLLHKIKDELDGLQTPILHWFASGDCMRKDEERICLIIEQIQKLLPDVVQMGFTRNINLWAEFKDIMIFTTENKKELQKYGFWCGRYAIPVYTKLTTKIFNLETKVVGGLCGAYTCTDPEVKELEHAVSCKGCFKRKMGCFTPLKKGG